MAAAVGVRDETHMNATNNCDWSSWRLEISEKKDVKFFLCFIKKNREKKSYFVVSKRKTTLNLLNRLIGKNLKNRWCGINWLERVEMSVSKGVTITLLFNPYSMQIFSFIFIGREWSNPTKQVPLKYYIW
jgi:hypothetical protein